MVLRIILLSVFIFNSNIYAKESITKIERKYFNYAKKAYQTKRYEITLKLLTKKFNFKNTKTPNAILALGAYTYLKLKNYKNSNILFSFLIQKQYKKENAKLLNAYLNNEDIDDINFPSSLMRFYHYRGEALSHLYTQNFDRYSEKTKNRYRKLALSYANILLDSDYEDDSVEEIISRIESYDTNISKQQYKKSYFINLAWISFREKVKLLFDDGSVYEPEAYGEGYCVGGGHKWFNAFWELNVNGCLALATMNVNSTGTISYKQLGVSSFALFAGVTGLYKPKSGNIAIGLGVPIVYKSTSWSLPNTDESSNNGCCSSIDNSTEVSLGINIETKYGLDNWAFFTKFGRVVAFPSSVWSFGVDYVF